MNLENFCNTYLEMTSLEYEIILKGMCPFMSNIKGPHTALYLAGRGVVMINKDRALPQ